jgi:hypothetical protein
MILNDIDLGGRPVRIRTGGGQLLASAVIQGARSTAWSQAGDLEKVDIDFWIEAWQGLGGNNANSLASLRILEAQLEELRSNPAMQPVYFQPFQTNQSGPIYPVRTDPRDGWYWIEALSYDPESHNGRGAVEATATLTRVAPATPSSLGLRWSGGSLASTYSGGPVPLLGYPIGSTAQVPNTLSRTGGEGAIPLSVLASASSTLNPALFVRPSTIAGLFTGGVRVYDTINTTTNPIPAAPGFIDTDWVQVYGTQHDFVGDLVLTNGLVLLLIQSGTAGIAVYVWNTSLSTPGWDKAGVVNYNDSSFAQGTVREINLERVSLEDSRVRLVTGTSNGNYAMFKLRLQRGRYETYFEYWPLTEANSISFGVRWGLTNAGKIAYDENAVADIAVTTNATLATTGTLGWSATFGQTSNAPLIGWLYQNAPSVSQGLGGAANTDWALGDASGPAQNGYRLYGFFAVPFGSNGSSVEKLQAEAESGTLGTGWTNQVDAAASAGHTAQCASGTTSGNDDKFGTTWQPPSGLYDIWFRVKVTSAAGSASEMTLGWWDATSAAFVAGASTTFKANQASTSYVWLKANGSGAVAPPAGHNVQWRAVTAATLGTNWFIDEAVLLPNVHSTIGLGSFPGDLAAQFLFERESRWTRG